MATTSISITPQFGNNTVTAINCGTSIPRLSGTIDLSAFSNLQNFRCVSNDITSVTGYENNSNLVSFVVTDNKLTGSIPALSAFTNITTLQYNSNLLTGPIPALSALKQCEILSFSNNQLTGPIPSLSGLANLLFFYCQNQTGAKLTGPIPKLSGSPLLRQFWCFDNNLSGPIPSLSGLNNLQDFRCYTNQLTGPIPSLSALNDIRFFNCSSNQLTGFIPSLSGLTSLREFYCHINPLGGSIPALHGLINLRIFRAHTCGLTGTIPSLSGLVQLFHFLCYQNQLIGSIPSLNELNNLSVFDCRANQLTGFDGGSVSNTLGTFQANNNQLNQSSVNSLLSAFVVANRTLSGSILNVGGTGNAAPSYTGGVTTTSPGTNFTRSGTLVTVTNNITPHGHVTGNIVTITGITPTAFQGTFVVTRITDNQFQYTTLSSGAATGAGTATMRKTSDATSGYASYQNLALVSRTGGPWTITINQP